MFNGNIEGTNKEKKMVSPSQVIEEINPSLLSFSLLRLRKWFAMVYVNMMPIAATPKTNSTSGIVKF